MYENDYCGHLQEIGNGPQFTEKDKPNASTMKIWDEHKVIAQYDSIFGCTARCLKLGVED